MLRPASPITTEFSYTPIQPVSLLQAWWLMVSEHGGIQKSATVEVFPQRFYSSVEFSSPFRLMERLSYCQPGVGFTTTTSVAYWLCKPSFRGKATAYLDLYLSLYSQLSRVSSVQVPVWVPVSRDFQSTGLTLLRYSMHGPNDTMHSQSRRWIFASARLRRSFSTLRSSSRGGTRTPHTPTSLPFLTSTYLVTLVSRLLLARSFPVNRGREHIPSFRLAQDIRTSGTNLLWDKRSYSSETTYPRIVPTTRLGHWDTIPDVA